MSKLAHWCVIARRQSPNGLRRCQQAETAAGPLGGQTRADEWRSPHKPLRPLLALSVSDKFDRILESPHPVSELEKGQMKGCPAYFVIAVLLTILDAVLAVYYGMAIWNALPGDIRDLSLLVLLASLGTTSLVNVWVQAILGSAVSLGGRTLPCGRSTAPIPGEVRGYGDV